MSVGTRKDGDRTRARLLEAAASCFAVEGYRGARTADICREAGANVAAVNYHFGGKEALYVEVWRQAVEQALAGRDPDGGGEPTSDAPTRLRARIRAMLGHMVGDHLLGRLVLHEMIHPTGLTDDLRRELLSPLREGMRRLLGEILGPRVTERDLVLSELSVVNQCLAFRLRPLYLQDLLRDGVTEELMDGIADHVTRFSLAGLAATRTCIEAREEA